VKPQGQGKHPTADEYRTWGSARAAVIVWIVIFLIAGGIVAYLLLTGHHLAGAGHAVY
jgi:hypothetical protein